MLQWAMNNITIDKTVWVRGVTRSQVASLTEMGMKYLKVGLTVNKVNADKTSVSSFKRLP